jgi:hypothetical protein
LLDSTAIQHFNNSASTIIRFIGSSDSSTNLDAFDPIVLLTGICEQILSMRYCGKVVSHATPAAATLSCDNKVSCRTIACTSAFFVLRRLPTGVYLRISAALG